jgi:hypothetical protein
VSPAATALKLRTSRSGEVRPLTLHGALLVRVAHPMIGKELTKEANREYWIGRIAKDTS